MTNNKEIDVKNLTIDGFTTPCPMTVDVSTPVNELILKMEQNEIRHLPVIDKDNIAVGIITDRDIATVRSFGFSADLLAQDLMSKDPVSVNEHFSLMEAAFMMSNQKLGSLIVTNSKEEVSGIFTSTDALNALVEVLRGEILESDL